MQRSFFAIVVGAMLAAAAAASSDAATDVVAPTAQDATAIETVPNLASAGDSLALSADGKFLLAGGTESVRLWDVATGRLIRTFTGHADKVTSVQFAGGGAQLLSASKDRTVKLWDLATGKLLRNTRLQVNATDLFDAKLSPDGNSVLVAPIATPIDGNARLFDTATGRLIRAFPANASSGIISVAFSADGKRAVSAGSGVLNGSSKIKLWDVASGRLIRSFEGGHAQFDAVYLATLSPDGSRLLSSGGDRKTIIWDAESGHLLQTLGQPSPANRGGTLRAAAFSSDGKLVATGGDNDKVLRIWDVASGRLLRSIEFASWGVGPTLFRRNSTELFVADNSTTLKIFDADTGADLKTFGRERQAGGEAVFVQEGSSIVIASKSLSVWNARAGQLADILLRSAEYALAISRDGKRIAWKRGDESFELWDADRQETVASFRGHTKSVNRVAISPDGTLLASTSYDKTARVWDAATGRLLQTFTFTDTVQAIDFAPDGRSIVAGDFNGVLRRYDVSSGKQLFNTKVSSLIVWSARFSPDGKTLIVGATENTPMLVDAASGRILRKYQGHTDSIFTGPIFAPDGKTFLSGSNDKTVKLWDTATGNVIFTLQVNAYRMVFSPDGRRILLNDTIINAQTGETLVRLMASDDQAEWVAMTPEGFFNASAHGADLLSVVRGLDVYAIDQFYQSLYRPDLVRERLAGDPRGLVREAAAQLDLNKVIASGSAPDVRVTLPGRALPAGTIDATQVSAEAEINDRGGGIGRVEWRVNGVTAGVDNPPPAPPGQPARLTRSLALDPGANEISVVAYNASNLIASAPSRLSVATTQPTAPAPAPSPGVPPRPTPVAGPPPRLFVLVAGVNDYADKRIQLSYAVSDAKEVARGFNEAAGNLYQSVEVKLLTDAEVTRDKLDAAFSEITGKAQASDVFVLYLAGHGKTVDGRYYFIPQDFAVNGELSDKNVNAAVKAKAIAQDQLQRWFAQIPARRSVILFDTCDSGTLTGDAGATQQLERGAANDRLAQATGRSIITASSGSQEALEGYRGHGLFTYEMLDALNRADGDGNGTIEVTELAAYVYAAVSELSLKVFRQQQAPQMRITANYALTKQTRILQDEVVPVAEAKPAFQLQQTAQLQVQPGPGATVVRSLSAKTAVTVLENKNGWALIAAEGKPLGYVAARDLAPLQ